MSLPTRSSVMQCKVAKLCFLDKVSIRRLRRMHRLFIGVNLRHLRTKNLVAARPRGALRSLLLRQKNGFTLAGRGLSRAACRDPGCFSAIARTFRYFLRDLAAPASAKL